MTSDERREVALSLREEFGQVQCQWSDLFRDILCEILKSDERLDGAQLYSQVAEKLADLIDPKCENESEANPVDGFVCSECGWMGVASRAYVDEWLNPDFDETGEYAPRYCPNCGARVVRGDE